MKRQGRRTGRATRKDNTSVGEDEPTRKSYNLRKRKCETEPNEQDKSLVNENIKRKCLKNDDQRTGMPHKIPPKEQKMQYTKMDTSKEKQPQPRTQNKETHPNQPIRRNLIPKIQPVGTKRLNRLSRRKDKNSKRSNLPLIQKKAQVKGEHLSKTNLTKINKIRSQRILHGTHKPGKKELLQGTPKPGKKGILKVTSKPMSTSKAPEKEIRNPKQKELKQSRGRVLKNYHQTKEEQLHSNMEESTEAKHCRIPKPKMINQRKRSTKSLTKRYSPLFPTRGIAPTKDFSTLFLKTIDARFYPEASNMSNIHGISVSDDNLIWVNHLGKCVQLLNSSGEILRTIDLDHSPVFNCCTPSGDLLETQGNARVSRPVITMISRDGNIRVLADLSSYATKLYGILCENETIFVVGCSNKPDVRGVREGYFIVKLSMSGEVEGVYNTKKEFEDINHVISLNGEIIALCTNGSAMIPVKDEIISSRKVNRVCISNAYSASASVDNLGNVILASNKELMIIDPSLEFIHKIHTGIGGIVSTAVDRTNQLWLGDSLLNENIKRRCLKYDTQKPRTQHKTPRKEQKMQRTKIDTSKEKRPQPRIQNKTALFKQPIRRNITEKTQTMGTKHLTRLSITKDQNKRKTSDSNPPLIQKVQVTEEHLSRGKFTKRDKDRRQRIKLGIIKPGKKGILQERSKPVFTLKVPEKEICNPKGKVRKQNRVQGLKNWNKTKEGQIHSNIQERTDTKYCRIAKQRVIEQKSTKTARKLETNSRNSLFPTRGRAPTKDFSALFKQNIDARFYPEASQMSNIHGMSVSHDNLIWVNHSKECVQVLNSSGEVLRTIHLKHIPVFSCCTPSGDLLETQGYARIAKPVITMISKTGKIRKVADLSSYATNLLGILCENETIFVVGYSHTSNVRDDHSRYFIMKLSMSGEVEGVYNTKRESDDINHIISLNGEIIALRTDGSAMIPLKDEIISSRKVNRMCIDKAYSASASVDNLGNVILASNTELMIIDPSLKFMHKIDTGIESICSTAVDKNNQLWFGTYPGRLYSAQYLK